MTGDSPASDTGSPRYPYGDMVLFGMFGALIGYGAGEIVGAVVGIAIVVVSIIALEHCAPDDWRRGRGRI